MKLTARTGDAMHEVIVTREEGDFVVTLDGSAHRVDARKLEADFYSFLFDGKSYEVSVEAEGSRYVVRHGAHEQVVELSDASRVGRDELHRRGGPEEVVSVMPGKVVRLLVAVGDQVQSGQGLVVIEAMKMENEIGAPRAGRVAEIAVHPSQTVESGAKLLILE